jgi:hypothetical protein
MTGGDDRIRTCEGLLTLNGLANRRLQPLGHISVPQKAKPNSSREPPIVKQSVFISEDLWSRRFLTRRRNDATKRAAPLRRRVRKNN